MQQKAPNRERRSAVLKIALAAVLGLSLTLEGRSQALASNLKFEISFPASAHSDPMTGRVFVVIQTIRDRKRLLRKESAVEGPHDPAKHSIWRSL